MNGATQLTAGLYYMPKHYFTQTPSIPKIDGGSAIAFYVGKDSELEREYGWTRSDVPSPLANHFSGSKQEQRSEYYDWLRDWALVRKQHEVQQLLLRLAAASPTKPVVIVGDSHTVSVEAETLAVATTDWVAA